MSTETPLEPPEPGVPAGGGLAAEKAKRLGKLERLRERGHEPYPFRFDRDTTAAELRAEYGDSRRGPRPRSPSPSPAG